MEDVKIKQQLHENIHQEHHEYVVKKVRTFLLESL